MWLLASIVGLRPFFASPPTDKYMASVYIADTGYFLPERILTNDELSKMVDTTQEWIESRVGIRERRVADAEHNTSDLAAFAVEASLQRAGWDKEDLDLFLCATSTPDSLIPATASWSCQRMQLFDVPAFDINAACSGFVYGMGVARAMMQTGDFNKVAFVTAEKYTRVTDYTDRTSCIFFGDSAGSLLLTKDKPEKGAWEVVDTSMKNFNDGADVVTTEIGGFFWQDGRRVKNYALGAFKESAKWMLEKHGIKVDDLRAFVAHQANSRVLQTVCDMVGIHESQHWHNVEICGNQGAAGSATTFCMGLEEHQGSFKDGDTILVTTFGSGFTSGSALLRWVD